ncbi:MAG: HDOD domain-containing protein [Deltaproteobacteria bacterium]|nr:HDOD domain-containing protein [Deltaproteobacteria bacterium]MBW2025061.1 HDOD domain-containing protein [Deltaproteobacteria bacterium]MBW2125095.1 HDOD domain-containing protein [Deltaproteobacteria bacterium]
MSTIEKIIEQIDALRPIPKVAHKVLAIVEDPKSSASDLAEVVIYDQSLTANVLRLCNSPYYGLPRKVDSIQQAIAYMGMAKIAEMVLMKLGGDYLRAEHKGYDLREGDLWTHAVSSALIAREICEIKKAPNPHLIFTAALLKDIGKVILHTYVGEMFEEIFNLVEKEKITFREAEEKVIGIDHAELGARVAEKWQFSAKMVHIIRNHHLNGSWSEDDVETAIVYVADTICMMMGLGIGCDGLAYRFHTQVIQALDINDRDLQEIMANFAQKFHEVEHLVGME